MLTPALKQKIIALPKAELHVHIEGTLEPELIFALAQRNGITLPHNSVAELRSAYAFTNLQSFLDIYYAGCSVLITEQDFFDMATAYIERARSDHVIHAEIFFDPQSHTARGISMQTVIGGLARALDAARVQHGFSGALILCFLRHLSEEDAFATLHEALPFKRHFIGVGLDSSELGHPPEKFARVFAKAREEGLHAVAHAGEEGDAAYVWDALKLLHAERIDHGVRAVEDPALVQYLAAHGTALTVCPLSNTKLKVFKHMGYHTLHNLMRAGVKVTLNSDDPTYFGGYMNANWLAAFEALPLTDQDAYILAKNSFEASFASPAEKTKMIEQLDRAWSAA